MPPSTICAITFQEYERSQAVSFTRKLFSATNSHALAIPTRMVNLVPGNCDSYVLGSIIVHSDAGVSGVENFAVEQRKVGRSGLNADARTASRKHKPTDCEMLWSFNVPNVLIRLWSMKVRPFAVDG